MATYSVHSRPGRSEDGVVFVREGFSWPAFLFSVPWCLWHRMWVAAAVMFAVLAVISIMFSDASGGVLTLTSCLIFGWEASEFRRLSLSASGYRETAIVAGNSIDDAELRYFASVTGSDPAPLEAPKLRHAEGHEPLGLFGTA